MANSYCNDKCKKCGQVITEGDAFIAQPVTLTKEGYGRYYGHERPGVADGRLRIKYHGGGTGHRMAFHIECWEDIISTQRKKSERLIELGDKDRGFTS